MSGRPGTTTGAARRPLRIALVGFGHVGRRLAARLSRSGPYARALRAAGVTPRVTGIATARHGLAVDERGLSLARCLSAVRAGRSLAAFHRGPPLASAAAFVRRVPADVLVELTPLDPRRGEPAIAHVRAALRRGLHVVTANKGPVAFAYRSLRGLAGRRRRLFLHEAAVMDGAPVFNLVERCLPGARVLGFRGTLNSTTSLVLTRIEQGMAAAAAVREAQALGIAEADPANDLDGWDAAVKGAALASALMDAPVRPARVRRRGIQSLPAAAVRRAARQGRPFRLVTRAWRAAGGVRVRVGPERLAVEDPLYGAGSDSALVLQTDLMGEIAVLERGGTVEQTAYGLLSDLVAVARAHAARRP
ncbi:MAG: homoserine dehydrogenase [Acidobacteria bacterium]|nr:MAG: homoserine dehydrogenase [Acidobacteriota bacterium]PYQ20156.1 MAG: homoserine dehydrogenase [Acidobacteriota bacterium]